MSIPTQREYEAQQARLLGAQLHAVDTAPLAERREAREAYREAMAETHAIIGERVEWLIEGCYGYGACDAAARILAAKRGNKVAQLGALVAALEWRCPAKFANQAWNTLTPKQQAAVTRAIVRAMKTAPAV